MVVRSKSSGCMAKMSILCVFGVGLIFSSLRSVVLSRSVRDMERGRRGDTLNNSVFNDRKQRAQEHGT